MKCIVSLWRLLDWTISTLYVNVRSLSFIWLATKHIDNLIWIRKKMNKPIRFPSFDWSILVFNKDQNFERTDKDWIESISKFTLNSYSHDAFRHTRKSKPTRNGLDQIRILVSYPKPINSKCVQTNKLIEWTHMNWINMDSTLMPTHELIIKSIAQTNRMWQ